jgi:phospho-N-acetylmuramoyl-pentapeptide-transferase
MIYHLSLLLQEYAGFFNIAKYLTSRSILSLLFSLILCLMFYPYFIRKVQKRQLGQVIRKEGPQSHLKKEGTPTMGGLMLVFVIILSSLLWAKLTNPYVWLCIALLIGYGYLGFIDDYKKVTKNNSKGLSARQKLFWQSIIALGLSAFAFYSGNHPGEIGIPFTKGVSLTLGPFYIPLGAFVIVATSNGVNLTDGLDGLAIGPIMIATACYALICYVSGNFEFANYLKFQFVPHAGELSIVGASVVGAGLGFLWYNTYPAQIFMGDSGSLSLGGLLGLLAVLSQHELLLVIIGGVFVLETVSVITQVVSYKTSGKRIFRMAPIHHHFELKGWAEPKVIVRFWIISIILALIGLLSLKIR